MVETSLSQFGHIPLAKNYKNTYQQGKSPPCQTILNYHSTQQNIIRERENILSQSSFQFNNYYKKKGSQWENQSPQSQLKYSYSSQRPTTHNNTHIKHKIIDTLKYVNDSNNIQQKTY
jgi:hypothetical protein